MLRIMICNSIYFFKKKKNTERNVKYFLRNWLPFLEKFIAFQAARNFFFLDIYSSTAAAINSVQNCFNFFW